MYQYLIKIGSLIKFYSQNLSISDSTYRLKKCDVLFLCNDVDRSISLNNQAYSPIIDRLKEDFDKMITNYIFFQKNTFPCYYYV